MTYSTKDEIEAGADLTDTEIKAAKKLLRRRLRDHGKLTGCCSYLQRNMGTGYNHAARILEYLEVEFITPPNSNGERFLR